MWENTLSIRKSKIQEKKKEKKGRNIDLDTLSTKIKTSLKILFYLFFIPLSGDEF